MPQAKFTDLVRGLYRAASTAQAMLINQFTDILKVFFDEENGHFIAKMVTIKADDLEYRVPLITFVKPSGLLLKKMEIDLSAKIDEIDQKCVKEELHDGGATYGSFKVSVCPTHNGQNFGRPSDRMDVKIIFELDECPEALQRTIDDMTNTFLHVKPPPKQDPPQNPPSDDAE